MKSIALLALMLTACASTSPPPPGIPEGQKRPINAMSTAERDALRFIDADDPNRLKQR